MMNKELILNRSYMDIQNESTLELTRTLVDIRLERYMADPEFARDFIRGVLEHEVSQERLTVIDELYNEGYWS